MESPVRFWRHVWHAVRKEKKRIRRKRGLLERMVEAGTAPPLAMWLGRLPGPEMLLTERGRELWLS